MPVLLIAALAYPLYSIAMNPLAATVACVAVALAVFMGYPPAKPSNAMWEWVKSGDYFNHKGHSVFYKVTSGKKADGPVLLLLHGFPTHSYDFAKILPLLLEDFSRVVTFDALGFGFSDKPREYSNSLFEQADIAEELLERLGVSKVHILSHDMGDTIAQELMARFEEAKVKNAIKLELVSVCLTNGGIFPEKINQRWGQKLLLSRVGPYIQYLGTFVSFKRGFTEIWGPRTQPSDEEVQDWWTAIRHKDGNTKQAQAIQYLPQRYRYRERWVGALQKSSIPLHLIYGPSDPVNPVGIVEYYKETCPNGSIDVLESHIGHYPQWEAPKETAAFYRAFFKIVTAK